MEKIKSLHDTKPATNNDNLDITQGESLCLSLYFMSSIDFCYARSYLSVSQIDWLIFKFIWNEMKNIITSLPTSCVWTTIHIDINLP